MNAVVALVDCENFYVSCERVFDPSLRERPVVVLSNNDGCVIARSRAVKAAGVPMGAPFFEWAETLDAMGAVIKSSNYALYGDMSRRVMQELEAEALRLERYSIDEAFLTLPALSRDELRRQARRLQRRVRRCQGVPIRVGIGPTKTLAKVADGRAKGGDGCYVCPSGDALAAVLRSLPVDEVWGIGSAYASCLREHGLHTAEAFRQCPDAWIRSQLSVVGLRIATELRGTPCLALDDAPTTRKSLIRSRSFSTRQSEQRALREAVATHAQRAAEKLREEGLVARGVETFITTKRFGEPPYYSNGAAGTLPEHTARGAAIVKAARRLLRVIYRDGYAYKKAGVRLYDLRPARPHQESLFGRRRSQDEALAAAVDQINRTYGRDTIGVAAAESGSAERDWTMTRQRTSPRYTTRWDELPVAQAKGTVCAQSG
jgi:DNA polymerase V